jgi:hypothetical protein
VTSTNRHARARRPSRSERRFVSVLATVILMASFACGDPYRHTNPYDPAVPVTITVLGPDSLFSYTEQAHFTAQIVPAFPDTAVQFSSSDNGQFQLVGAGTFEAGPRVGPPLWPATSTVTVTAGIGAFDTLRSDAGLAGPAPMDTAWRHIGSKTVVITQRVVRMLLRCPDTHICDTLSAGGMWSVWVDGFDALNQKIYALTSGTANPATGTPIATFVSRDTTVASVSPVGIRAANVTARKSGTTWIVATRDVLLDSLQLVVR